MRRTARPTASSSTVTRAASTTTVTIRSALDPPPVGAVAVAATGLHRWRRGVGGAKPWPLSVPRRPRRRSRLRRRRRGGGWTTPPAVRGSTSTATSRGARACRPSAPASRCTASPCRTCCPARPVEVSPPFRLDVRVEAPLESSVARGFPYSRALLGAVHTPPHSPMRTAVPVAAAASPKCASQMSGPSFVIVAPVVRVTVDVGREHQLRLVGELDGARRVANKIFAPQQWVFDAESLHWPPLLATPATTIASGGRCRARGCRGATRRSASR